MKSKCGIEYTIDRYQRGRATNDEGLRTRAMITREVRYINKRREVLERGLPFSQGKNLIPRSPRGVNAPDD